MPATQRLEPAHLANLDKSMKLKNCKELFTAEAWELLTGYFDTKFFIRCPDCAGSGVIGQEQEPCGRCLSRGGITKYPKTIGDLDAIPDEWFLLRPNCDPATLQHIRDVCRHGMAPL